MSHSTAIAALKQPLLSRFGLWLVLCFIATSGPLAAHAQEAAFAVRDVRVALDEGVYELDAHLDFPLPEDARKAVDAGLTLRLTYEIVDRPGAALGARRRSRRAAATLRSGVPRA